MSAVPAFFSEYQQRVDAELRRLVPAGGSRVQQSMAYTVHAPSKRVRAVLTLLCAELCGGAAARAVAAAAAIELVHASSLILDDLPAMDDAPLRRGRPANHLAFGEAIAILAAFGLLNLAFGVAGAQLRARRWPPPLSTAAVATAVGLDGLIGGQAADLLATDQADQLRDARADPSRQDRRAVRRLRHRGGADRRGGCRPAAMARRLRQEPRAGVSDHRRPARRRGGSRRDRQGGARRTSRRRRSCRSAAWRARGSSPRSCARRRTARCAPFGRRADRLRALSAFVGGRDARDTARRSTPSRLAGRRAAAAAALARLPGCGRRSLRAGAGARRTRRSGHCTAREPADRRARRPAARVRRRHSASRCSCPASSPACATASSSPSTWRRCSAPPSPWRRWPPGWWWRWWRCAPGRRSRGGDGCCRSSRAWSVAVASLAYLTLLWTAVRGAAATDMPACGRPPGWPWPSRSACCSAMLSRSRRWR